MVSCLLVFGLEKSGKTYSSKIFQETLSVKCIHFDFILGILTECIRIVFEEDSLEDSFIHRWDGVFQDQKRRNQFNNDIIKLIHFHKEFFRNIYETSIRDTVNHIEFRRRNDPKLKRPRIGHIGWQMRDLANEIISIVKKDITENSQFCIIEGRTFKNMNYRKAVKHLFENTLELECHYDSEKNLERYRFEGREFNSLKEVEEQVYENVKKILNKNYTTL